VSIVLLVVTPMTGMLIASGRKSLKSVHRALGRITPVVMVMTAVMGAAGFLKK
jgi:uncharacterized membrane protein YozB (DUF420 family)